LPELPIANLSAAPVEFPILKSPSLVITVDAVEYPLPENPILNHFLNIRLRTNKTMKNIPTIANTLDVLTFDVFCMFMFDNVSS